MVQIKTDQGTGSGFIVDADGIIATAYHVVEDARNIEIVFADLTSATATILGQSLGSDLALVSVERTHLSPAILASSGVVSVGDTVLKLGYGSGSDKEATLSSGVVSALSRLERFDTAIIQTDTALNPGDSGGPLFSIHGEVVGIVSSKLVGVAIEGVGYAVDVGHLIDDMQLMVEGGTKCQPYPAVLEGRTFWDSTFGYYLIIPQESNWIWEYSSETAVILGEVQRVVFGRRFFISSGVFVIGLGTRGEFGTLASLLEAYIEETTESYDVVNIIKTSTVCFPTREVERAKEVELDLVIDGDSFRARWLVFYAGSQGFLMQGMAWPEKWDAQEEFIDSLIYSFSFEKP